MKTAAPSIQSFRLMALALVFFAAALMGSEPQCGIDREEPEPLDERLVGFWRDVPPAESGPTDTLDIHEDDVGGTLIRMQHNRGNAYDSAMGTVTIDGTVYTQQSGSGLHGTFIAPAQGNQPSRTLTLEQAAGEYQLTWEHNYAVREFGTFQLHGSDEVVLTRPEVGGVLTSVENEMFELWSRGSVRWDYYVLSGPVLLLRDENYMKSTPGLTGGWWFNSAGTRFYSFGGDGVLTEVRERPDSQTSLIMWRETNSFAYRNRVLGSNSGQFEVGQRIVGEYEVIGEDENKELIVYAERPLVQRRHAVSGDVLELGGPNGVETYTRLSGEEGLHGTWTGGGVTWTFETTLQRYTREAGDDVETGRFEISTGSTLINFHRKYSWYYNE